MKRKRTSRWHFAVFVTVMLFFTAIAVGLIVYPTLCLEHYLQVWEKPLIVSATVCAHESYDDDGDTDYRSYVSYEVFGLRFEKKRYEDKDKANELTPVGTQLELAVSPKDPSVQIARLKSEGMILPVCLPIAALIFSLVWYSGLRSKRSARNVGTPDRETIQKDAKLTVIGRFALPFWSLTALGYGFIRWRYALLYPAWFWAVAAVCGALFLWRLMAARSVMDQVNRGEYDLRQGVLIEKEHIPGDESDTYELTYRTGNTVWKTNTSKNYYNRAWLGEAVLSVFLPGKKKPLLHYDTEGDAC